MVVLTTGIKKMMVAFASLVLDVSARYFGLDVNRYEVDGHGEYLPDCASPTSADDAGHPQLA